MNNNNIRSKKPQRNTTAGHEQVSGSSGNELEILRRGANSKNNFESFKRKLINHCKVHYGSMVRVLTHSEYPKYEVEDLETGIRTRESDNPLEIELRKINLIEKIKFKREMEEKRIMMYGTIFGLLSDESRDIVTRDTEYTSTEQKDDVLKLWNIIERTHQVEKSGIDSKDQHFARRNLGRMRQLPGQSIVNFFEEYKNAIKALETAGASKVSEPGKLAELENMVTVTGGQFPKKLEDAYKIASGWIPVEKFRSRSNLVMTTRGQTEEQSRSKSDRVKSQVQCWACGKRGHILSQCRNEEAVKAYNEKKSKKGEASVKLNYVMAARGMNDMKNELLIDSQSNIHLICNRELVNNVQDIEKAIRVRGITDNILEIKQTAHLNGIGEVYFSEAASGNVLSLSLLNKDHVVEWKPRMNAFVLYTTEGNEFIFKCKDDMYVCESYDKMCLINSGKRYDKTQLIKEVIRKLGYPSIDTMKKMIKSGAIDNVPLDLKDLEDFDVTNEMVEITHGRETRKKPNHQKDKIMEKKSFELEGYMDLMFVGNNIFLVIIFKPTDYIITSKVESKERSILWETMMKMISFINIQKHKITKICCDNEKGFEACRNELLLNGILLETCGVDEHVPIIERAIRTIKEKCRIIISGLKYELQKSLIGYLVSFVVIRLNMHIRKNQFVSPFELITGNRPNFVRHCKGCFGEVVEAKLPYQDNTMNARTERGILLHPKIDNPTVWYVYVLKTRKIVLRQQWKSMNLSEEVVEELNNSGEEENQHMFDDYDNEENEDSEEIILDDVSEEDNIYEQEEIRKILWDEDHKELHKRVDSVDDIADENTCDEDKVEEENIEEKQKRYNLRENRSSWKERVFQSYHTRIEENMNDETKKINDAIEDELMQMINKEVFIPVREFNKKPIGSFLLTRPKYDANGNFVRYKSRLVANGKKQYTYSETFSPTAMNLSVMLAIKLCGRKGYVTGTIDIKCAYLNARMDEDVFMVVDKETLNVLLSLKPTWSEYCDQDRLIVKLNKALYGCKQSARLWHMCLRETLENIGYGVSKYDSCLFHKSCEKGINIIVAHVDDLLISVVDLEEWNNIVNQLKTKFEEITYDIGTNFNYLGFHVEIDDESNATLRMRKCVDEIIKDVTEIRSTPANKGIFENGENGNLDEKQKKKFRSDIMKLFYLGKKLRPDILFTCTVLASKVEHASVADVKKLERLKSYLKNTKDFALRFNCDNWNITAHADASHAVHTDGKGHGGYMIKIGDVPVIWRSLKLRNVTKSSTESELYILSECTSDVLLVKNILEEIGIQSRPATIYQDNQSTIHIISTEQGTMKKLRHVKQHLLFVKDYIINKEIDVKYIKTEDMVADIFTKPLQGELFRKLSHECGVKDNI